MTKDAAPAPAPLAGLRVLDFSRVLSGPFATLALADLGAEVIKIEPLGQGDETRGFPPFAGPLSHYFIALNRNKRSLALDLKSPEGLRIARDLAARSDVVVENFRPGVMDRLGLGPEALGALNPRLVYCAISGFGADSPLAGKPAFDIVVQALSGVMSVNGTPGGAPTRLGLPMGDLAGSIFAVFGILAALNRRHATGRGGLVEVAMLDGLIALLGYFAQLVFVAGKTPGPVGSKHPSIVPYGAFPTRDGHVIVACLTETFWRNFARALDMPELAEDARFARYDARLANRAELEALVEERMRRDDSATWLARLDACDVPNAPILDVAQALEQAHCAARGLIGAVTHPEIGPLKVVRGPLRFDGKPGAEATPPPLLGADGADILGELLGKSPAEVAALRAWGVIG